MVRESTLINEWITENKGLSNLRAYIEWYPNLDTCCLDGEFTSEVLREIADHMDKYREDK